MGKSKLPPDDRDESRKVILREVMEQIGVAKNDQILAALRGRPEFWPEGWEEMALTFFQHQMIRSVQKQIQDEDGMPVIASVQATNEEGQTENLWKHEAHWEKEDFRQIAAFHIDRAQHHIKVAHGVARKARKRYGIQIRIPWPDDPGAAGSAAAAGR